MKIRLATSPGMHGILPVACEDYVTIYELGHSTKSLEEHKKRQS